MNPVADPKAVATGSPTANIAAAHRSGLQLTQIQHALGRAASPRLQPRDER